MAEQPKLILVIDDDPDVRETIRLVLERGGYRVSDAATGEDGLRRYKEAPPDLVIVDLMMEEVDAGTAFVKELRMLGNTAPVYMLSSVGDALYGSIDTTALGLSGVFQKPLDPGTLLATVGAKLGR